MIDYGEDKQSFGAPEIKVGPISQFLTALYIGVFLFAFFVPEAAQKFLPQVNADLPKKFWTLITGLFIFPESAGFYTGTPAGFWVIVTFLLIFFVVRPLEEKTSGKAEFILFLAVFMLGPALILWGLSPKELDPAGTWSFWFNAASGWAFWKFRALTFKIGEKIFPRKWIFALLGIIPLVWSIYQAHWSRGIIYLVCMALGIVWGIIEEHRKKNSDI